MNNTNVIMNEAMECLLNNLGVIKTEVFISTLKREPFDYTEWRRDKFDDMTAEELNRAAAEYGRLNHNNT